MSSITFSPSLQEKNAHHTPFLDYSRRGYIADTKLGDGCACAQDPAGAL